MTKVRSPLTFELALTKVAAVIGWPRVAEVCGQAERTVRNWSDVDTSARVNMDAALRLDVECLECELADLGSDDLGVGAEPAP